MPEQVEPIRNMPPAWYWSDVQLDDLASFPTQAPERPEVGAGWYDPEEECLYVWDGAEWVTVPLD